MPQAAGKTGMGYGPNAEWDRLHRGRCPSCGGRGFFAKAGPPTTPAQYDMKFIPAPGGDVRPVWDKRPGTGDPSVSFQRCPYCGGSGVPREAGSGFDAADVGSLSATVPGSFWARIDWRLWGIRAVLFCAWAVPVYFLASHLPRSLFGPGAALFPDRFAYRAGIHLDVGGVAARWAFALSGAIAGGVAVAFLWARPLRTRLTRGFRDDDEPAFPWRRIAHAAFWTAVAHGLVYIELLRLAARRGIGG